jgi:toxin-antitoxin system PIN domain toxin
MVLPAGFRAVALLDVNVLVALFNDNHIHHVVAHEWFAENRANGWATCPLTESGVIRIIAGLPYLRGLETTSSIRQRLVELCDDPRHSFWPDSLSLRDELFQFRNAGHNQLTDIYLLGLAFEHDGRLATFDRRISHEAVLGATADSLEVIGL